MKILVLGCKDYPPFKYGNDVGGIEIFCYSVLPRLKNIRFILYTRKYKNPPKEEVIENVHVVRLPFLNIPMLQTFTFNLLSFLKAMKIKADLIWAHEPVAGFFAYWLSKFMHIPYILHIHSRGSLEPANINRKFWMKVMEKFAYKNPKQTIFVSKRFLEESRKKGIHIPIGVEKEKFQNAKPHNMLKKIKGPKILFIGRLEEVKGLYYLFTAFSRLNTKTTLLIIGEGSLKNRLKGLTKKLKIQDRVLFLGNQKPEQFLPFVDLFVLPSLSEGMPHTIVEALVSKTKIVATNVGEIPYLIDKKYLVKTRNIEELKNKMELALKEKGNYKFKEEFLIENVVKKIELIISANDK